MSESTLFVESPSCLCTTSATLFSNANFGHLSWTFLILFEHFFLGYLDQKKTLSRQNKTPDFTFNIWSFVKTCRNPFPKYPGDDELCNTRWHKYRTPCKSQSNANRPSSCVREVTRSWKSGWNWTLMLFKSSIRRLHEQATYFEPFKKLDWF